MVGGIRREELHELNELFFMEEIEDKRAQRDASKRYREKVKKTWLLAQLSHYGIGHKTGSSVSDLTEDLGIAIEQGMVGTCPHDLSYTTEYDQCDEVPREMLDLEALLRQDHQTKNEAHILSQKEQVKDHFKSLDSYAAQANYSPRLFVATFFHASRDTEEEVQAKAAIALPGLQDTATMRAAAERLALHTQSCGQDDERTLVVGQDRQAVLSLAYSREQEQAQKREQDRNKDWDQTLDKHHSFIKSLPLSSQTQEFSVNCAVGQYKIRCPEIERNWHPDSMDLQVIDDCDDSITDFDFGVIEGVMMLDTDEDLLHRRWKSQQGRKPRNKLYYEDGSSVTDKDDPCNESDGDELPTSTTGLPCDKPEQPSDNAEQPDRKRQKLRSPAGERRLYFVWRSRETGQNEIQLDLHGGNRGSILFLDATCSTFRG